MDTTSTKRIAGGIVITGDDRQPLLLTTDPSALLAPFGQDGAIGRNTFRAGSVLEFNLALIKSFSASRRQRVRLRVDSFTLCNRDNFGVPVRCLEAPGFGQATNTVTTGRRIQFGLKYSF